MLTGVIYCNADTHLAYIFRSLTCQSFSLCVITCIYFPKIRSRLLGVECLCLQWADLSRILDPLIRGRHYYSCRTISSQALLSYLSCDCWSIVENADVHSNGFITVLLCRRMLPPAKEGGQGECTVICDHFHKACCIGLLFLNI